MAKNTLQAFKPLLPYVRRYRARYLAGFLCLMAVDMAQMIIPQFMRQAIDLIAGGAFTMSQITPIARNMILVMAAVSLGRFLWRFCIHGASRKIEKELREKLFSHLLTLSYDFYQKNKIGDLMSRASSDLNAVRESIGMGLVALVDGTVMAAAILAIIFIQDPRAAALAIIPLPLITFIILFFGSVMGARFKRAQEAYAAMSDTAQETFAGIRVVKSFVKEWWFIKKFADTNEDYQNANMALVRLYGVFFPFISFLSGLTFLIALLAGGSRVVTGQMSPGAMVALFRYLQMLVWPLMGAGFVAHMIQRGAVSLGRVYEIMDALPSIASPAAPETAFSQDAPAITVTDLTFRYPEGRTALEGVSLTIAAGSFVGITGRTGAGKSTLIKTFTRTVDPPANTVRVKGVGVEKWDLEKLRACFGVTPQDSYLFSDSIKRNICYGLEGTLNEEGAPACQGAANALSLAALERDMASFALGWDTVIGERGLTLSGGQKQRVAVARALAVEPEILILDDSLSAVDRETEGQVLKRLLKARKGRTTIIISHRISTLKDADKVVVLDKGRVAEQGAPAELMAQGGYFSRMAAIQDPPGGGTADKKEGPYG